MAVDREPATFLPESVREVLKRKSSRDPSSRFPTKLHLLLTYVSDNPNMQEMIGLSWLSDDEFQMNKVILSNVMGLKVNTLNVNLRDLHFEQKQRDKDGWTRWKRSGFTRASNSIDADGEASESGRRPPASDPGFLGKSPSVPFTLARVSERSADLFLTQAQQLWTDVLQCSPTSAVDIGIAIDRAAERFRYHEQPLANAREVISAIIRPAAGDRLFFADFCRFLAMFGPEKTVMLKIAALLTCSNATGKWLTFDRDHNTARAPFAYFLVETPNCLCVQHADNLHERVFNDPVVPAGEGSYLVDDYGMTYRDWDDWFAQHPVRQGFGATVYT
jgi:hypothetical protein